ncbi:unknown [Rickettsia conorii str. Malish 7]|uniref:Entericidin B-like protein n=2 Tax=Rickettsia conorii TaxID=781 RepID=Q92GG9_RICCN|nr:unknown [Rickettsia conorii str. Malish 7]
MIKVKFMRSALITSILVAVAFLTSACNTMQGAGQDIQVAGKKLKDSAESNKPQKGCGCPHSSAN